MEKQLYSSILHCEVRSAAWEVMDSYGDKDLCCQLHLNFLYVRKCGKVIISMKECNLLYLMEKQLDSIILQCKIRSAAWEVWIPMATRIFVVSHI